MLLLPVVLTGLITLSLLSASLTAIEYVRDWEPVLLIVKFCVLSVPVAKVADKALALTYIVAGR